MKTFILSQIVMVTLFITSVFAQKTNAVDLNTVLKVVKVHQNAYAPEKAYLQTDKNTYFLGDTLWFKAYLFDKLSLSAAEKSKILYIELNDDTLDNVKRISIPISYGIGWAQIPLSPKQFHEGTYTLTAYTNWMQNTGSASFFRQRIYIGKPSAQIWRIHPAIKLNDVGELDVKLVLSNADEKPVASKNIMALIRDSDKVVYRKEMQTNAAGEINLALKLTDKLKSEGLRLYISNATKDEPAQLLSIPLNFNRPAKIDLQFLPEGGHLVNGLKSVVGIKALNEDGKGVDVSGTIFNSKNEKVTEFKTVHKGIGKVSFTPSAGESYFATINDVNGNNLHYDLPKIETNGTVMHIESNAAKDSLILTIQFSKNLLTTSNYNLVGESRGFVSYARAIDAENTIIKVAKNIFPSGIAHFSLLKDTTAVNERLVYINQHDNFSLTLTTDKPIYASRDSIVLNLNVKDNTGVAVNGSSFSVAVTDDAQYKADTLGNNSIATSLLFTSDIKGFVEQPSFYLKDTPESAEALDNLMLTQGWVGLNWKNVFTPKPVKFEAEKSIVVTGKVTNANKKPVEGAQVLISSQKPVFFKQVTTNKDGIYRLDSLPLLDTASFFIMRQTKNGQLSRFGKTTVNKFEPAPVSYYAPPIKPWYLDTDSVTQVRTENGIKQLDDFAFKTGKTLNEVVIKGKKKIPNSFNTRGADFTFDPKAIKASGVTNLYDFLRTQLPGFRIVMKNSLVTAVYGKYTMNLSIDAGYLPFSFKYIKPTIEEVIATLKGYNITAALGIEVLYSQKYTRAGTPDEHMPNANVFFDPKQGLSKDSLRKSELKGFGASNDDDFLGHRFLAAVGLVEYRGTIFITTRFNAGGGDNNLNRITYRPVNSIYAKQFYAPKYITRETAENQDLRSTVYWKPDIVTDVNGNATIKFNAGQKKTMYTVIVQGADLQGGVGGTTAKIKVE
ncbi:hypothetical protein ABIB40_001891 [Pedobacter sp. UYP30]|uniref:carboxypeptidase-like regulatory domain-containing protein n=1 Tax=Pedobacter sp. UYP30 TaxID=1756400 RepID=UPI003390AC85